MTDQPLPTRTMQMGHGGIAHAATTSAVLKGLERSQAGLVSGASQGWTKHLAQAQAPAHTTEARDACSPC